LRKIGSVFLLKSGGRACIRIRQQRIRVSDVLELLAAGASHAEVIADYPYLEAEDIQAVLHYAALQHEHPILLAA
jgi:uncharacterized protein (DUF433 family)